MCECVHVCVCVSCSQECFSSWVRVSLTVCVLVSLHVSVYLCVFLSLYVYVSQCVCPSQFACLCVSLCVSLSVISLSLIVCVPLIVSVSDSQCLRVSYTQECVTLPG